MSDAAIGAPAAAPAPREVGVTELVLRDAHQSLLATRMAMEDMVDACADIDAAGYWCVECWGGATFDACIRFLNEDPWERLRTFRELHAQHAGCRCCCAARTCWATATTRTTWWTGSSRSRPRTAWTSSGSSTRSTTCATCARAIAGRPARPASTRRAPSATRSAPLHTVEGYVRAGRASWSTWAATRSCIKDMAALLQAAAGLRHRRGDQGGLRRDVQVHVHCHATTGVTLVIADEGHRGRRRRGRHLDHLAVSWARATTRPSRLVEMLEGTAYTTDLDSERLLADQGPLRRGPAALRPVHVGITGVETDIFDSQIPGGMISNMESQLRQQGAGDKLEEVLAEVPRVREVAGYPPLVTPSSQIVGTQAVFNVLMGRYKVLTARVRRPDARLLRRRPWASATRRSSSRPTRRPRRSRSRCVRPTCSTPEWDKLRDEADALAGSDGSDEDVLTYAMFPQVAPGFFATRSRGPEERRA